MVSLAFSLAASGNFPVLLLSMLWSGCTTRGAVWGRGSIGLLTALVLTVLSPAVWQGVLGQGDAPFPYTSPAIFSMPLAFLVIWLVSRTDRSARADQDRPDTSRNAFVRRRRSERRKRTNTEERQRAVLVSAPDQGARTVYNEQKCARMMAH